MDALGTTRAITDSSGTTADSLTTDAFGMTVAVSGSTPTPFGFAGQHGYQSDAETGLMRLGHRYYDNPRDAKNMDLVRSHFFNLNKFLYDGSTTPSKEELYEQHILFQEKYNSSMKTIPAGISSASIIRNYGCTVFRKMILNTSFQEKTENTWFIFVCYISGNEGDRHYAIPLLRKLDNNLVNSMVRRAMRLTASEDDEVIKRILEIEDLLTSETRALIVTHIRKLNDSYITEFLEYTNIIDRFDYRDLE